MKAPDCCAGLLAVSAIHFALACSTKDCAASSEGTVTTGAGLTIPVLIAKLGGVKLEGILEPGSPVTLFNTGAGANCVNSVVS